MKKLFIFASIFLVLVLLVACGPPKGGKLQLTKPEAEEIGLTLNPVETGTPKYGGVLIEMIASTPSLWDMHKKPSFIGWFGVPVYNNLVQNSLVYFDTVPETLIGDLAKEWEVSDDGLTYTFYLNEGVTWHDGKPFTADDVVYSLDKMTNPETGSRIAGDFMAYKSAENVDDYTVRVYLTRPSASFLLNLAGPYAVIQPKHLAGADDTSPDFFVGTGPFMFKSWTPQVSYELEKNPNYFKKDEDGNPLPYLDGLKWIYGSWAAFVDVLITGQVDFSIGIYQQMDWDRVQAASPNIKMCQMVGPTPYFITFNTANAPLNDQRVRRAIGLLVQQEDQVLARFGSENFGFGGGIFNPSWGISQEEIDEIMGWDQPYEARIAEAKRLMEEAGYGDGAKLRLVWASAGPQQQLTVLGDKLRRHLNIDAELVKISAAEMFDVYASGEWDIISVTVLGFLGDPSGTTPYFRCGDSSNWSGYCNSEVDRLIEEQDQELDSEKRREIIQEIERIILTDLSVLPGLFWVIYPAWYPHVKNFRTTSNSYGPNMKFEEVWLER